MRSRATFFIVLVLVLSACGTDEPGTRDPITVFAAASLTEAFTQIASEYEEQESVEVRLSFGPSDGLATQIQEGAPADVFASASPRWMDVVAGNPGVTDRADFARNVLVVITPADDPAGVDSVEDLGGPGTKLVLAAEGVPAGDYARELLANTGIADAALGNVVSNEDDVKGVVQKVALGEADAGIVYRTDVTAAIASDVVVVEIPDEIDVVAVYPIAVVAGSEERAASEFVAYVLGPGRAILLEAGFLEP